MQYHFSIAVTFSKIFYSARQQLLKNQFFLLSFCWDKNHLWSNDHQAISGYD